MPRSKRSAAAIDQRPNHGRTHKKSKKHQGTSTSQKNSKRQKVAEERDICPTKKHSLYSSTQEQLQDFNNLGADYFNNNNPELQELEDQTREVGKDSSAEDEALDDGWLYTNDDPTQEEETSSTTIEEASHPPMQLKLVTGSNNPRTGAVPEAGSVSKITHPSMVTTTYTVQND